MISRKPQINFQVCPALKALYDQAKISGHGVTRFCAAGLLVMIEDAAVRAQALKRLQDWEAEYADASEDDIRVFVQDVQDALARGVRGNPRERPAREGRRAARRSGSA